MEMGRQRLDTEGGGAIGEPDEDYPLKIIHGLSKYVIQMAYLVSGGELKARGDNRASSNINKQDPGASLQENIIKHKCQTRRGKILGV